MFLKYARTAILAALAALAVGVAGPAQAQDHGKPGEFDYYVLTLSWSPAFCASKGAAAPAEQCGKDKNFGFVVHGLWPQYEKSGYPASCAVSHTVPEKIVDETFAIMPSKGLMNHEWQKHGTCSGLSVEEYFADLRDAYAKVNLPENLRQPPAGLQETLKELVSALVASGQGVPADGVVPSCNADGHINEVMLCLDKNMAPRACSPSIRPNCKADATLSR